MLNRLTLAAVALSGFVTAADAQAKRLPTITPVVRTLLTMHDGATIARGDAVVSPNGRLMLYYGDWFGDVRLYDIAKKSSRVLVAGQLYPWDLVWSPMGDQVAFARFGEVRSDWSVYALSVDPATGASRGELRRMLVENGESPAFSPDGKRFAYVTKSSDGVSSLMVMPASGGAAHKVVSGRVASIPPRWSPDGKSLYYAINDSRPASGTSSTEFFIEKVTLDGGRPQRLMRANLPTPGLSPDGQFMIVRSDVAGDTLRHFLVTDALGQGIARFQLSRSTGSLHWMEGYRLGSVRMTEPGSLHSLDLRTGKTAKVVPAADQLIATPEWSADGSRFVSWEDVGDYVVPLVIRDRLGNVTSLISTQNNRMVDEARFSPDGRYVAYRGRGSQTLIVYDTQTETQRTLATAPSRLFQFIWRPDSRGIVFNQITGPTTADTSVYSIHEVTLDGRARLLLRVSDAMRRRIATQGMELTQSAAVAVTQQGLWLMPYDGTVPTQIVAGPVSRGKVTPDGKRMVVPAGPNVDQGWTTLRVVSLESGQSTVITPPFNVKMRDGAIPMIHPDGKSVLLLGRPKGSVDSYLYLVPIDGSEPRRLVTIPQNHGGDFALSRDGQTLLYTLNEASRTTVFEIDFTAALKPFASGAKR